jgi:TonB family protein
MHLTLPESGRSFFQTTECVLLSVLAHAGVVWGALTLTDGSGRLPLDEREARVFFLLPPDRVDVRDRQSEILQWGRLGGDIEDGKHLLKPDGGWRSLVPGHGSRGKRDRTGAKGQLPFGPMSRFVPDTAFSVLEVDEIVERVESSAAPVYPPELLAIGTQGLVRATYVVDTSGVVDTTTIKVILSNDPRFTASVVEALGHMRFRPAKRAGKAVRQLVEQKFSFKIVSPEQMLEPIS